LNDSGDGLEVIDNHAGLSGYDNDDDDMDIDSEGFDSYDDDSDLE